jgi:hypothetical protein
MFLNTILTRPPGVTSNSDAAQLAETLVQNNCKTKVRSCFILNSLIA